MNKGQSHPWRTVAVVAFRFATGQHLDGKRRSDATFLRDGLHADPHYWGRGGEPWWALLAGWKRAAARWTAIALACGFVFWRTGTEWTVALILGPLAGVAAVKAARAVFTFEHYRTRILPLHYALAPVLDIPMATRPKTWLAVPADYGTNPDAEIVVYPPDGFTASDRERDDVRRAVTAKLGIEAPDAAWPLDGRKPRIVFTQSQPPPGKVGLAQIRDAIEAAEEHQIVMGRGKKDQVNVVSVDNDSPHIGLSMQSGDGKSITARNMGAQLLYHGALVLVIDYKLISHMWARGLPNAGYAGTPAEIEAALRWLEDEVTRRNKVALSSADIEGEVHANVGPRIFVIAEELNATQGVLKKWWNREMDEKGRSPGSEALDQVMYLGRQVHVNVLQIGQRLSVKASGSGDARENLGVLIFKDPTASAWKMLVGDRHVMPPASGHPGRLQVVTKPAVTEVQGAFLTGEQSRALALSGTVAVPPWNMPCVGGPAPRGVVVPPLAALPAPSADQGMSIGTPLPVPAGPPGVVTLSEAVNAGLLGPTIHAARKARQRDESFPGPVDERGSALLYNVTDLAAYVTSKGSR